MSSFSHLLFCETCIGPYYKWKIPTSRSLVLTAVYVINVIAHQRFYAPFNKVLPPLPHYLLTPTTKPVRKTEEDILRTYPRGVPPHFSTKQLPSDKSDQKTSCLRDHGETQGAKLTVCLGYGTDNTPLTCLVCSVYNSHAWYGIQTTSHLYSYIYYSIFFFFFFCQM